jgi:two-component system, chemotaxis family, chemotaxis protein CheY
MKILVIDDSSTMRLMLVKILRELGYTEITAVSNSEEAIPIAFNNPFDVILTDWNLPKMSGYDLVKHLKNMPETQKTPIIMITTIHDRVAILKALKAGVQGYILKPVGKEILAAKLHEIEEKIVVEK